eukprot:tig00021348_g20567.t1
MCLREAPPAGAGGAGAGGEAERPLLPVPLGAHLYIGASVAFLAQPYVVAAWGGLTGAAVIVLLVALARLARRRKPVRPAGPAPASAAASSSSPPPPPPAPSARGAVSPEVRLPPPASPPAPVPPPLPSRPSPHTPSPPHRAGTPAAPPACTFPLLPAPSPPPSAPLAVSSPFGFPPPPYFEGARPPAVNPNHVPRPAPRTLPPIVAPGTPGPPGPARPGAGTSSAPPAASGTIAVPEESLSCPICMEGYSRAQRRIAQSLPCGHTLCGGCVGRVAPRLCPTCREPFLAGQPRQNVALMHLLPD